MTSAPNSVDQTLPRPPKRLVPPMTAAAIASSSSVPPPVWVLAAAPRETAIRPPRAAMVEAMVKTATRIAATLMPARRAASALPPTAKM